MVRLGETFYKWPLDIEKMKLSIIFVVLLSCSLNQKKVSYDLLNKNYIQGVRLTPNYYAQSLPLLLIYFDYIKNHRCKPRKDLFNLFFEQMIKDQSKVTPIIQKICKKTTNIKSCDILNHFELKKSKSTKWGLKKVLVLNLIFKEFANDKHFKSFIQIENLKFVDLNNDDFYWFDNFYEKNPNNQVSSFLDSLRTKKELCLNLVDRHVILKLEGIFMEKFNKIISKLLHSKTNMHVNLNSSKQELWEELSNETFLAWGKKWVEKGFLSVGERYCKIDTRSFCNKKKFFICSFLRPTGQRQCDTK